MAGRPSRHLPRRCVGGHSENAVEVDLYALALCQSGELILASCGDAMTPPIGNGAAATPTRFCHTGSATKGLDQTVWRCTSLVHMAHCSDILNAVNIRSPLSPSARAALTLNTALRRYRMDNKTIIGLRMRATRRVHGHSQTRTASLIGVGKSRLANWESGKHYPDVDTALRMSEIYGVPMDWIYKGDMPGMDPDKRYALSRAFDEVVSEREAEIP